MKAKLKQIGSAMLEMTKFSPEVRMRNEKHPSTAQLTNVRDKFYPASALVQAERYANLTRL
jgi:hypothetical protein